MAVGNPMEPFGQATLIRACERGKLKRPLPDTGLFQRQDMAPGPIGESLAVRQAKRFRWRERCVNPRAVFLLAVPCPAAVGRPERLGARPERASNSILIRPKSGRTFPQFGPTRHICGSDSADGFAAANATPWIDRVPFPGTAPGCTHMPDSGPNRPSWRLFGQRQ